MTGPLQGINVLDFGQAGVGPWAGTLLSWLGANVIKIERPEGDVILGQGPFMKGLGVGYTVWNMSKKSAILNLKEEQCRRALEPLIRRADAMSENLRPGVMDRLGVGYQSVLKLNPNIVFGSSPGWGETGPLFKAPGTDADFQVFTGFASATGAEGGRPEMARHAYHFDLNASAFLAGSVVLGLIQRDRIGQPQHVHSTHLGSTLSQMSTRAAEYLMAGSVPRPLGSAAAISAPNQAFLCQNKRWLAVGVENEQQWAGLCQALIRDDLRDDPRFRTNLDRVEHRAELAAILTDIFASRPSWWWNRQLVKRGVPVGYFYDYEDLRNHAQVLENESIVEIDEPHQGKVLAGGLPWRFSRTPAEMYRAPYPGEHTREVEEKGFDLFGSPPPRPVRFARPNEPGRPPLAGYRVLDATQGIAGPYVGQLLADAGAEVIKIEPPGGDYARGFAPQTPAGTGALFEMMNRNKQGIVLDLDSEEGRRAFRDLAATADVVLEDWGTGQAAERGLSHESLAAANPGLVTLAITPFGEVGPFRAQAGSELVVQAMSDYWGSVSQIGAPPQRWSSDSSNMTAGAIGFLGVVASLLERNRSGEGQRIAVSLLGTMLCFREASWSVMSDVDEWEGPFALGYASAPWHGWKTKDRQIYFRLHNASEEQYTNLLLELGMVEALADPRFQDGGRAVVGMGKYAVEVLPIWEKHLGHLTSTEVVALAERYQALALPFNTFDEAVNHPQVEAVGVLKPLSHPVLGEIRVVGAPFEGPWQAPDPAPAPSLPVAAKAE